MVFLKQNLLFYSTSFDLIFFFFQAEDGIRDGTVTGVQTCALPIWEYTVTFTLAGFSTVRREGVSLEGSFTATINIDMRVGELSETITVSGESPIVDVQSVRRQTVLDNDIISAIPSSRSYNNLIQLIPNSVNQAGAPTDVQVVPGMVVFGGFGGRSNEGRVNVDGISVGSAFNGAGVSSYIADVANAREIAMITSGGLGESEGGGPSL